MSSPRSLYRCRAVSRRVGLASACARARCYVFVVSVHFGSDPVGTGVAELFENCQCALPSVTGRLGIVKGLMGVAEGDKGVSLVVTVAELTIQVGGFLVAGCDLAFVAEMTVSVA